MTALRRDAALLCALALWGLTACAGGGEPVSAEGRHILAAGETLEL